MMHSLTRHIHKIGHARDALVEKRLTGLRVLLVRVGRAKLRVPRARARLLCLLAKPTGRGSKRVRGATKRVGTRCAELCTKGCGLLCLWLLLRGRERAKTGGAWRCRLPENTAATESRGRGCCTVAKHGPLRSGRRAKGTSIAKKACAESRTLCSERGGLLLSGGLLLAKRSGATAKRSTKTCIDAWG